MCRLDVGAVRQHNCGTKWSGLEILECGLVGQFKVVARGAAVGFGDDRNVGGWAVRLRCSKNCCI